MLSALNGKCQFASGVKRFIEVFTEAANSANPVRHLLLWPPFWIFPESSPWPAVKLNEPEVVKGKAHGKAHLHPQRKSVRVLGDMMENQRCQIAVKNCC